MDKAYRIGIDARLWNETGVGRYIRNLVSELQKIDKENEYILFVLDKDIHQIKSQITSPNFQIKTSSVKWHSVQEQLVFPKILEKEHLDLVHFPYFSTPIFYKGKYVLTIHDLILHRFPTGKASTKSPFVYWLKHTGYKYVISQAAKNAAKILTVSNATKKEIITRLRVPEEKVIVAHEGIDAKIQDTRYKIQKEDAKCKILNTKYLLYVGNAYPHKNLERLLQAFAKILSEKDTKILSSQERKNEKSHNISISKYLNIKLVLVGKQDYFYERLEQRVKQMGLENSIIFKHNVTDEELSSLYQHALALVMPSLMEGFGLPILEAMEHGCLVVASDIAVFHEIAGDIPFYFQTTDVNQLEDVLESIVIGRIPDAEERKEKGKRLSKKFSWKKMAEKTLQVYKSCLSL